MSTEQLPDGGQWVTMRGRHVYIHNGKVIAGLPDGEMARMNRGALRDYGAHIFTHSYDGTDYKKDVTHAKSQMMSLLYEHMHRYFMHELHARHINKLKEQYGNMQDSNDSYRQAGWDAVENDKESVYRELGKVAGTRFKLGDFTTEMGVHMGIPFKYVYKALDELERDGMIARDNQQLPAYGSHKRGGKYAKGVYVTKKGLDTFHSWIENKRAEGKIKALTAPYRATDEMRTGKSSMSQRYDAIGTYGVDTSSGKGQ